jgi:diaminopimelate epimerase
MRFEKWQALGNDYLIVDAREREAPLDPEAVRRLCDRHAGVGADGVLELSEAGEPGYVARVRIVNPDGSEAELSGNGVRQAVLYLRARGWTDARQFSVLTAAGEIRPTILSDSTCRVDMGRARLRSPAFPAGGPDGTGELRAAGRPWSFQHVSVGNPQCAIALGSPAEVDALDVAAIGAQIERSDLFPQRTNVSFYAPVPGPGGAPGPGAVGDSAAIRARIFERGVGETASSGTGACGAAVAHVLRGGDSPVTVRMDGGELEVEVGEDLHVDLTGWAVPVFAGEVDEEALVAPGLRR